MADEKIARIKSLKRRHTRVLHYFFRGSDFTVSEICKDFDRNEKTIRGYLTDIYEILGVPDDTNDNEKREWVVREYADTYEYVFKRGEWDKKHPPKKPEIFISAPAPRVVTTLEASAPPISVPTNTQATTSPAREAASSPRINLLLLILLISAIVGVVLLITNLPLPTVAITAPTNTTTQTETTSPTRTPNPTRTPTSTNTSTNVPTKTATPSPTPTKIPEKDLYYGQVIGWSSDTYDSRGPHDFEHLIYDWGNLMFINTAAWSPDGSQVAFIINNQLHLVDINGENHKILYSLGQGWMVDQIWYDIAWSSDGQEIYFVVINYYGKYFTENYPTLTSYSISPTTKNE